VTIALVETGGSLEEFDLDAEAAQVRPPEVVERYEQ
jgi:hypothetical protein